MNDRDPTPPASDGILRLVFVPKETQRKRHKPKAKHKCPGCGNGGHRRTQPLERAEGKDVFFRRISR